MNLSQKIVAIIPARMAATRFPNKPLALLLGLPMIEHIRRRVEMTPALSGVYVATCDEEIRTVVENAGGKVIMTAHQHERCTDRIAEAARQLEADIIVNVQGDEPLIRPEMIDAVVKPLIEDATLPSANLVSPITTQEEFENPNAPKVVTNLAGDLLYISRESIPSRRKYHTDHYVKLKQLGIMAFRAGFLRRFAGLKPTPLEQIESVDMMRAVEHGFRVRAVTVDARLVGVDMPDDVAIAEKLLASDPMTRKYL